MLSLNASGKTKRSLLIVFTIASFVALSGSLYLFKPALAFPTNAAILDNFNRGDTTSLSNTTASGPYNWNTSQTINTNSITSLGISSNQMYQANGFNNNAYIDHQFGADTEVSAQVPVLPTDGSYIALWSRIQQPGSNSFDSYGLVYIHSNSGNATWSLRRYDNGASTQLGAISAPALTTGESLGIALTGTGSSVTFTAYHKVGSAWNTVGSVNDNSGSRITSGGYSGIEIADPNVRIDNFSGGDVINNTSPSAPTLSLPADNATGVSTSPQLQLKATDADADDLRYKIEICSDAACSNVIRTIDQTSSQTGWIDQDKQGSTAYTSGTSLSSSTLATHVYQSPALDSNTQYWWRAYAIDPNGTNTFGLPSAIFSFTTAAASSSGNSGTGGTSGSGSNTSSTNASSSSSSSTSNSQVNTATGPTNYWGK